ncbi:large helicase-related protein [Thermococcus kodakarensis KOD1]|uniref:Large helicase-related protein n=1 Tax=Thermococcus kodakarensis (strain ATCC BAA-918 / JCM 12380 / KOD1) TaxID=69014 RepID=Q5JJA4_THEKO|nr:DEAD/DEAH box helicase [Thermococcus kodakarensis]WCN28984.1 DEAD/DEAH box helicase [Thermococcus kodakarensis]WCN31290.1 DEAD/DEAH box helicase [Thermococcus kodakarensis]BAD85204.1 large helicase-related protein [Thermococcus kodakarensis KOD1]
MHPLLKKVIKERFGKLNRLQQDAFREVSSGKSVLIIAPTGSGKTEAAVLPVFNEILEEGLKPISALYIAPLKALNRDLLERLEWWGKKLGITVEVRHGDTSAYRKAKQTKNPPQMLIITPETLGVILTVKSLRKHLVNVKFVIVDEIAELVDNKRGAQLLLGLERLAEIADFRRIGMTATVGNEDEVREWLKADTIVKPNWKKAYRFHVLYPKPEEKDEELARELSVSPDIAARLRVLWEIVERHGKALIFTNTRQFAEILAHRLKVWGKPVEVHHGSLSREARINAERALKEGRIKALVCTSSMELGIDIGDVDVVIQYMSPRQVNRLVQRAGRAKHRIGEVSEAYIITTNVEDYIQSLIIAKHALEGRFEPVEPIGGLDVLAHFVVGLLVEYKRLPRERPYEIARRAYVYRDLSWEDYLDTLKVLEDARIIGYDEETNQLYLRRGAFQYYYENLSTIPDEVSWRVIDAKSGHIVGRLDESFVMDLEEGMEFVMGGKSWIVLKIDDEAKIIKARESPSIESAIPSWEGEMIPVPFSVAFAVGRLKRELAFDFRNALSLIEGVEFREEDLKRAFEEIRGEPFSTDRDIFVESTPKALIIHADFGNRANEAIGRIVHSLLILRYGRVFSVRAQAHAVVFKTPFQLNPEEVKHYLYQDPESVEFIVARSLRDSHAYRWRMLNVAKRFGALRRDAKIRRVERLFEGTVIERETLNELYHDKVDVKTAELVMEMLKAGSLRVKTALRKEPSTLARLNMTVGGEFLLSGILERDEVLELFKKRLLEHEVVLVCTNCGWHSKTKVARLRSIKERECPRCGSKMLAVAHPIDAEEFLPVLDKVRHGRPLEKKEERVYRKLLKAADLVDSYGFDAVLALASYGTGPDTAARILSQYKGEALLVALMERERDFIRTRRFWVDKKDNSNENKDKS